MAEASATPDVIFQRGVDGIGEDSDNDAWDDTALIKAYDEAVSQVKAKLAEQNPEFCPLVKTKKKKQRKKKGKKNTSSSSWKIGDRCQAVYTEDNEVYEAEITSIHDDQVSCTVQYIGYGNEEDHPLSELLPVTRDSHPSQAAGSIGSSQRTDTASETESVTPDSSSVRPASHRDATNGKLRSRKTPNSKSHTKSPKQKGSPAAPYLLNGQLHPPPTPPAFSQMPPPQMFPPFPPSPAHFPGYPATGPAAPGPHHHPMFPSIPPPPPLFSQQTDVEGEAMYSMLISWYMSGYHTGYYQGMRQSSSNGSAASAHR